jgi:ParB family chromosome partitioning protein
VNRKRGGLGRGLGALIPQESAPAAAPNAEPEAVADPESATRNAELPGQNIPDSGFPIPHSIEVPIESITPNPHQPRQDLHAKELEELANSVREHGVLQPLVVTGMGDGTYALIAGERRWRAARLAGLEMVPVVVKEVTSSEMLELALVENLQRSDLNPIEEAAAYRSLIEEFGLTQDDVAARVGKSRTAVTNSLRLLTLPPEVQQSLLLGLIDAGHARAILQAPDPQSQQRLMEMTVADGLSVRQVEALARSMAAAVGQEAPPTKALSPVEEALYDELRVLQDRFRDALGTKVQLSRSSRGGRLVIYFYSDEELERIYGAIVGEEE